MEESERSYQIPISRTDSDKSIRWKTDPEEVIQEIAHLLRGDSYDNFEDLWIENTDDTARLCNDYGIKAITTYLRGFLNKNLVLSNLDKEMVNKIAMEAGLIITDLIYDSYDRFEIRKENCPIVISIVDNNVYATLCRARDGFFTKHLTTTQRYIQHSNILTEEKTKEKRKLMPNIFGKWGGGNEE